MGFKLRMLVAIMLFAVAPMVASAKGKAKAENLPAGCARTALTGDASRYSAMCAAQAAIRTRLRDPDSARFDGMFYNKQTGAVCGFVAGKNGFGGYSQRMVFAVLPSGEGFLLSGEPDEPSEVAAYGVTIETVTKACAAE